MEKLFGTDGIRGVANQHPMSAELALHVGRSVASVLRRGSRHPRVVIGRDTRISGDMLAHAIVAGVCSTGASAELVGVLPTPAVACLTRQSKAQAGIVVSASHNPYQDNGIKVFGADGFKLSDALEDKIEALVLAGKTDRLVRSIRAPGHFAQSDDGVGRYAAFLKQCLNKSAAPFKGMKLVLDCANGATYQVAPALFSDLGAAVEAIHVRPDGRNINAGCGSEHPQALVGRVKESGADAGLAFDGDGDRLIAVDERGEVLSGDRILAICARHLKETGRLTADTVVSTVMSNFGLHEALNKLGIRHVECRVGDRYVMEEMRSAGAVLGGEDSGHMIFADHHTTGDGILSAMQLLDAMRRRAEPLSELKTVMRLFPQKNADVAVSSKPDLEGLPELNAVIDRVRKRLGSRGKVLVRYSGTQALCRVMVQAPTQAEADACSRKIVQVVEGLLR
jgi:phosphoglucosamine mutase